MHFHTCPYPFSQFHVMERKLRPWGHPRNHRVGNVCYTERPGKGAGPKGLALEPDTPLF